MGGTPGGAVFFDIGDTLASVSLSPGGDRIEQLAVYPYVPAVLGQLRDRGARLGILSDPGPLAAADVDGALEDAGLRQLLDPELVVYGPKDSTESFRRAADVAGGPARLVFVGEDPGERRQALRAGFSVVPHPRLAVVVWDEQPALRYVRVSVPPGHDHAGWRAQLEALSVLPLHTTGDAGTTVYAITTASAATRLDDLGFRVDLLGAEDEPLTTDLYLLRDDRRGPEGVLAFEGDDVDETRSRQVLDSTTEDGHVVAVPGGGSVEDFHVRGGLHGHNLKLVPGAPLRQEPPQRAAPVAERPEELCVAADEGDVLHARVRSEHVVEHVERYSGLRAVGDDGVTIPSRHIHHTGNAAAVATAIADLERIGQGRFVVSRHRFTHEGRRLENVEAELPGRGLDGIVLVTAHLDSTAARQPGYRAEADAAPGADDDASGVAGVLVAADTITALDSVLEGPRRPLRFVLFNAEEHGLVGSAAYARDQALLGVPIAAVFQMDMVGYDVRPERTFELHAGFSPSAAVEARSLELVHLLAELAPQVSPELREPQTYPAPGERDPAERRSDHSSFHAHGFGACLVSEDLFVGPGPAAPPAEMNPSYHLPTDAAINGGYAADIVRLVTAAAWVAATRSVV